MQLAHRLPLVFVLILITTLIFLPLVNGVSDGRNNEMDIYYAHLGAATGTSPQPPVTLVAITGSVVIAIVVILIYARRRRSIME